MPTNKDYKTVDIQNIHREQDSQQYIYEDLYNDYGGGKILQLLSIHTTNKEHFTTNS